MDQTWSNLISDEIIIQVYDQIFNFIYVLIRFNQICQNFKFFWSKWIRSVQNGSNWIKFDFWWNNHWNISSDFQIHLIFDQIESDLSKMYLHGSNWISDEIIIEIYHQIFKFIYFLKKMDQTWSNWIPDEIIIEIYHKISNFIYFLIRLN